MEAGVLAGLPKDDPTPHVCAGEFLTRYAWDARGGGPAAAVTPEGWKLFHDRLAEAEKRLTAAWDLDHECGQAAAGMVTVCMGLGRDRETMETWFRRAVAADPSRWDAFERKLAYLEPKWHGSADEVRAFARAAAGVGGWDQGLPLLLLQACRDLAPAGRQDRAAYFEAAWEEVGPALEEIRKRYPDSPLGASAYLYFAWQGERNPAEALTYARAQKVPLSVDLFRSRVQVEAALDWAAAKVDCKD